MEDETIKELGLTPEEFEQRKVEWAKTLRKSTLARKKELLAFMRSVHGKPLSAELLRRLSWVCNYRMETDPEFNVRCISSLPFELPLRIGSSKQDAYHKIHFINSFLICLYAPETEIHQLGEITPHLSFLSCTVEEDVSARLERQFEVYSHLASLIPKNKRLRTDTMTLSRIYTKLQAIEDKVDKCLDSRKKKKQPTQ